MNYKIAVLPGDGIGPEVMGEGTQVLEPSSANCMVSVLSLEEGMVGGASIDAHGKPLTDPVLEAGQAKRCGAARRHGRAQMGRAGLFHSARARAAWPCAKNLDCSPICAR